MPHPASFLASASLLVALTGAAATRGEAPHESRGPAEPARPLAESSAATRPQDPGARPTPPPRGVTLPPGPAARAFAGVGPDTRAAALPTEPAGGWDSPRWRSAEAWRAWAEAVRGEAESPAPDTARRARLARIALDQGRYDDAWDHLAATGGDPATCAALVTAFLPGVDPARFSGPTCAGGIPAALPDGVLLVPAVPPPSVPAAEVSIGRVWIQTREMRLDGLRIGAAELGMRVVLQSDGIQVDFEHRSGGEARFQVVLPEPADFEVRVAYVDWMRQDEVGRPLEVVVKPGDEPHSLFGRLRARSLPWPTRLPDPLPRAIAEHGLELEIPGGAPEAEVLGAAAGALSAVLGLSVRTSTAPAPFPGTQIVFRPPAALIDDASFARRKLAGMVTLAERFALRRR